MQTLKFSLTEDAFQVEMHGQITEIPKGLSFIAAQSLRQQHMNALAIEHAIEVIEEMLGQLHFDYAQQHIAISTDAALKRLSTLFFAGQTRIIRELLEHAFNEFVERTEHYLTRVDSTEHPIFLYFIFIREMMHHLNVTELQIK